MSFISLFTIVCVCVFVCVQMIVLMRNRAILTCKIERHRLLIDRSGMPSRRPLLLLATILTRAFCILVHTQYRSDIPTKVQKEIGFILSFYCPTLLYNIVYLHLLLL